MTPRSNGPDGFDIGISREKACYIVQKAREFDAKVAPTGLESGSNPTDDNIGEILEDYADDPTLAELRTAIEHLNEDELVSLIALVWIGRGDFAADQWAQARALAWERHRGRSGRYLIETPMLGDLLEEGLAAVGLSCEDYELGHL